MFRQRPSEVFFKHARVNEVGVIVRVPLASGLLTGKISQETSFSKDDHRHFNREGKAFDKGETFSGVPLEVAFPAVEKLKEVFGENLAKAALQWVLMFGEVSTVIPGASKMEQVIQNLEAGQAKPLSTHQMKVVEEVYEEFIKKEVHHLW